jgi:hypothetical protein
MAFVSFAKGPPLRVLTPFRLLAPLSPETLGVAVLENTIISGMHTEATTVPPPPPDTRMSSSNQPVLQRPNHVVTPATMTQSSIQRSILIPKGPIPPGPLSAPPVVSAPNPMYASSIDSHPTQSQYQTHRVPRRTSTVPGPSTGSHPQGHIMNVAALQPPHPSFLNRIAPIPMLQPLQTQPQVTNRSAGGANPPPQPAEGQRHPIAIPTQCGNPISDNIFTSTSD